MWKTFIYDFITYTIFIYSGTQLLLYVFIGIFSIGAYRKYKNKNSFIDYKLLAVSPYAPSLSILAPAYNEGANVIENVRSLLSIYYNNLEVIIINDGSKDNSLDQLIKAYDLVKTNHYVSYQIPTKKVRGVYKSRNQVYKKLVVIDKENGGKADALNVGINLASNDYIVCIDVDCILEQDALLKLMKPFLETTKEKVIATGGVVRIANSCNIRFGRLLKVKLPEQYLPRIQTLEYIRAFLLGRMAWGRFNGLMLISGAFGAFDKEIAIKVGGYNHKTVGEDMELVVRMRRYMEELKQPYKVAFIPDPLCWTEAPATYKILGRQRNRWTRGTIETLGLHKKMFLNPKYNILGLVCFPYWFLFEMCAPGVEFIGIVAFIVMALFKMIYWQTFFAFFAFIITFGYLYSAFAIYMEVTSYNQYNRRIDIMRLLLTALTEPFVFHPFVVWSGVKGYIDKIQKKSSWGEMTRQGLTGQPVNTAASLVEKSNEATPPIVEDVTDVQIPVDILKPKRKVASVFPKLKAGMQEMAMYFLIFTAVMLCIKAYELIKEVQLHGKPEFLPKVIAFSVLNEVSFVINISLFTSIIFLGFYLLNKTFARFLIVLISSLVAVIHAALSQYFLEILVPLGADLWNYSIPEIKQTLFASGKASGSFLYSLVLIITPIIILFNYIPKKIKLKPALSFCFLFLFAAGTLVSIASFTNRFKPGQEFSNNIALNKSYYFFSSSLQKFLHKEENFEVSPDVEMDNTAGFNYTDEKNYPFLHTVDTSANVLAPFFNNNNKVAPNIVFIAVEGLGRAFSNNDAYLGSFTPFLDSLAGKSLYWSNFLSAGGRTFSLLPSVFASLPFEKNGFLDTENKMAEHVSMLSILKQQGYKTNFIYGGDANFDNMKTFLKVNGTTVYDQKSFSSKYQRMPSENNYSWGYGDEEVFKKYEEVTNNETQPMCNIILTLSMHNPFRIANQEQYVKVFENRMLNLQFNETQKENHRRYKNQYASILYSDNAIRNFIQSYSKRADFNNTIFVITGDHRMPEISMNSKIDRYHVPLIIYSPLLKQSQQFASVSSHLDLAPTLLSFLGHRNNFSVPEQATWLGSGLDTATNFRNIHAYPLMQTKNDLVDFIMDDYLLNGEDLFKMSDNMHIEPVTDQTQKRKMQSNFARFKQRNNHLIKTRELMPKRFLQK